MRTHWKHKDVIVEYDVQPTTINALLVSQISEGLCPVTNVVAKDALVNQKQLLPTKR